MEDFIQNSSTVHTYIGGSNPTYAYDNSYKTSHSGSCGRAASITIENEHEFPFSVTLSQITIKMEAYAYVSTSEPYSHSASASYDVLVYDGSWTSIGSPAEWSDSRNNSGSVSNIVNTTIDVTLGGITKIKAVASSSNSLGGGGGTGNGYVYIYEIKAFGLIPYSYGFII